MSEEKTAGPPAGVPQPVFGISREALAGIVAGNRAALGLPPQERDLQAEQDYAEFTGYWEAQGYDADHAQTFYGVDVMAETFLAGMHAERNLAAQQPDYRALLGKSTAAHWNVGLPGEQKTANAHRREAGLEEL